MGGHYQMDIIFRFKCSIILNKPKQKKKSDYKNAKSKLVFTNKKKEKKILRPGLHLCAK